MLVRRLAEVARGDRSALEDIYRRTSAKLFGICLRILPERGEAEDVLQDIYLTVWQRASGYEPGKASPITWLATIARNRAIDRLRARAGDRRGGTLEEVEWVEDPTPGPLTLIGDAQERARLHACLGELEERQRSAVVTAFLHGATYEEVASHMGVPLGTMKSWVRRSLMRLRSCLEAGA